MSEETRVTDPTTGAQKGSKLCQLSMIPPRALMELGEHYGKGAKKYSRDNWRKGYAWSLSFDAAMRHAWEFWGGEDIDPETKSKHAIAVAWHFLALATFQDEHPEKDDRYEPCEKPDVANFPGAEPAMYGPPPPKIDKDKLQPVDKPLTIEALAEKLLQAGRDAARADTPPYPSF